MRMSGMQYIPNQQTKMTSHIHALGHHSEPLQRLTNDHGCMATRLKSKVKGGMVDLPCRRLQSLQ